MWEGHGGMGWWMLFGSVWFVLFWALIIWAVFSLSNRLTGGSSDPARQESALDIAKRRYASGEISREEFERLRSDLS